MSSAPHPSPHSSESTARGPSFAVDILPPLPPIQSEQIRKRIFTHSSLADYKYDFQAHETDPSPDNEELGHIGDQVFGLAVTNLIQELYPRLRVGPTSKVRDYVKAKRVLAEICVLYGLHKRLNLGERQASRLRAKQGVQVNVFKAYVGGVYRDQGIEVVSEWLFPLIQSHVEAAYQTVRKEYLLPPTTAAVLQPRKPTTHYPSPSSPTSSEDARPDVPQEGSGKAGDGVSSRPHVVDQSRKRQRRRRSDPKDGGNKVAAPDPRHAEGTRSPRRSSTGSDTSGCARKRPRSGDAAHAGDA